MAAVFPLDTSKPWTFNGVTYEYDAAEDRWFVISTNKVDAVDESIDDLNRDVDVINTVIDQEIENRTNLLNAAAAKNNTQDDRLDTIEDRLQVLADNIGVLDFAGLFEYFPLKTQEMCDNAAVECLNAAGGDALAIQECLAAQARCEAEITTEIPEGQFTSDVIHYTEVQYLRLSTTTLAGSEFDWVSIIEPGDYIELIEQNLRDSVLYQVLTDARADSGNVRVNFIRQTNAGDSGFNDSETYAIRVFKEEKGLDINAADARYVQRPYTVIFSDDPPELGGAFTGVLKNGELWYDTQNLELFVWNNNSWVSAAKPPSQDIVITEALADIQSLKTKPEIIASTTAPTDPKQGDLWFNPSTLKFAFFSSGAWINPDQS